MRMMLCSLCLALTIGLVTLTGQFETDASETIQRAVRGTVMATNTTDDPQTIVLKVILPGKDELIVGARVPADTKITRGKHSARLTDIKTGEPVAITYLKTSDGLIARAIHLP